MPPTDPSGHPAAALLVAALADAAVAVDAAGHLLAWNGAAAEQFGIMAGAWGRPLEGVAPAASPDTALRMDLAAGEAPHGATALLVWPTARPLRDDDVALQRARALERLAPGVAHDLANRIGSMQAFGSLLRADEHVVREYGTETIAAVLEAGDGAMRLAQSFVDLARHRPAAARPVRLTTAVAAALRLVEFELSADVSMGLDVPGDLPDVEVDPERLHQALAAVLVNALDALGRPHPMGRLAISARDAAGRVPPAVELRIADSAPPPSAGDIPHLFDLQPPAGCSPRAGLHLAVARRLLEADGGSLRYERTPDGRNALVLALPRVQPWPAGTAPAAAESSPGSGAPLTALVCEDDDLVRDLIVRMVRRAGFGALPAASGADALAVLEREAVDVVITDNRLAGMTGPRLHAAVAARHPGLRTRFVLVSGDPDNPDLVAFARGAGLPILAKPFEASALVAVIRDVARTRGTAGTQRG